MRYAGTPSYPGPTPETRRCRIRNRVGWHVVLATVEAERLRPFELFIDKAGNVVVQNILRRKWPLAVPHDIEKLVASTSHLVE